MDLARHHTVGKNIPSETSACIRTDEPLPLSTKSSIILLDCRDCKIRTLANLLRLTLHQLSSTGNLQLTPHPVPLADHGPALPPTLDLRGGINPEVVSHKDLLSGTIENTPPPREQISGQ